MKKYIAMLGILGLSGHAVADGNVIPLKKNMAFQTADTELRRAGWHARTLHTKEQYTYIGIENTMRSHGVRGIESCAVDRPICIIHYAKGNICLRIFTRGEEFKDLKIDSWSHECPPSDAL